MRRRAAILAFVVVAAACGTPTEPESRGLPVGWWIGETQLEVTDTNATLFLTCGAGTFPRPPLDSSGRFQADGRVQISIGPPPPVPGPGAPATFSGQLAGSTLTLTMSSPNVNHTWTLYFGGTDARVRPPTFCP